MPTAEAACRDYAHWAGEIQRLTDEIGATACPHEAPAEAKNHYRGSPSCFRAASEERLDQAYHYGEEAESYRRRTLDEVAREVADCPACSSLVLLIRARRHARQRFGVAKRAVRAAGKKLVTLTTNDR